MLRVKLAAKPPKNTGYRYRPFCQQSVVGVAAFLAQTGAKKIDLWFLEPSRLSKYKTRSVNRVVEIIIVNGQPIEAVRRGWGLPGCGNLSCTSRPTGIENRTELISKQMYQRGNTQNWLRESHTLAHFENLDHCLIVTVEKRSAI